MLAITLLRGALKLTALVLACLLLVGFLGQFPELRRYPWIVEVWRSLRPLGQTVATQLPTTFARIDVSLLAVLVVVGIAYLVAEGILSRVEDSRRGRVLQSRISEGTRRRLAA